MCPPGPNGASQHHLEWGQCWQEWVRNARGVCDTLNSDVTDAHLSVPVPSVPSLSLQPRVCPGARFPYVHLRCTLTPGPHFVPIPQPSRRWAHRGTVLRHLTPMCCFGDLYAEPGKPTQGIPTLGCFTTLSLFTPLSAPSPMAI